MLPGKIGGQVEGARSARNTDPAANAHEPVVFRQALTGLAGLTIERGETVLQPRDDLVQHRLRNRRVTPVGVEGLFLFVQVFEHIRLQIRARTHIHYLKNSSNGKVVVQRGRAKHQLRQPKEQVFETQIGANALVEGVFV